MADFASSLRMKDAARLPRILVLDADDRSSAATALIGRDAVADLVRRERALVHLLDGLMTGVELSLGDYVATRTPPPSEGRRIRLAPLDVIVSEQASSLDRDERH
jgi:hypothetical protein